MTPVKKVNPNAVMCNSVDEAFAYIKANPHCSKEEAKAELDEIRRGNEKCRKKDVK